VALEDKPVPTGNLTDAALVEAVRASLVDGKLRCARAHAVAAARGTTPQVVGLIADRLDVRLSRCQLGFFGYTNKQGFAESDVADRDVPDGLPEAIRACRNDEGDVSCAALWQIAAQFRIPRMLVGYVSDQMKVHVTPCQLGAF